MIWVVIYAVFVAASLGLAAAIGERVLADLRRPRRAIWIAAIVVSLALPAWSLFGTAATGDSSLVSLPFDIGFALPVQTVTAEGGAGSSPLDWLAGVGRLAELATDSVVLGLWVATSSLMLAVIGLAAARLAFAVRRAERVSVAGTEICLSDRFGPAILGFFRPRIVLPRWLAREESRLTALVLKHEREHLAARDQLLLLGAVLSVAAMPWNPALWWQLRRLRAAIEVDCDARVLRDGTDPLNYSEALFSVREKSAGAPLGAIALTEPVSELERRIRIMMEKAGRFSVSRAGLRLTLFVSLVGAAFAVNAPRAQVASSEDDGPQTLPVIRGHVYDMFAQTQICMDAGDYLCAEAMLDAVGTQYDLTGYESAQRWNFQAYLALEQDDLDEAIESYEHVVEDISVLPEGLAIQTFYNLAGLYQSQGRFEEAFEAITQYLALRDGRQPNFSLEPNTRGEYLPIVKVAPEYPAQALARDLEGHVVVEYTVTQTGSTKDIVVIESSSALFDRAAIDSVLKYKYKPRVIDGVPVEVAGVRTRIEFSLEAAVGIESGDDA